MRKNPNIYDGLVSSEINTINNINTLNTINQVDSNLLSCLLNII